MKVLPNRKRKFIASTTVADLGPNNPSSFLETNRGTQNFAKFSTPDSQVNLLTDLANDFSVKSPRKIGHPGTLIFNLKWKAAHLPTHSFPNA
jgi:hypothetical protein